MQIFFFKNARFSSPKLYRFPLPWFPSIFIHYRNNTHVAAAIFSITTNFPFYFQYTRIIPESIFEIFIEVSRPILYIPFITYLFNSKSSYIIDIRNNREFAHSPYRGISTIPCSTYISLRPELTLFQPMYTLYHNVSPNYRLHDTLCIARPTFGASGSPCTQFLPLSSPPCTTPFTSSKGRARATR